MEGQERAGFGKRTRPAPLGGQPSPQEAARAPDDNRIRTYLANERTFAAWVRTGIAIATVGFAIARFLAIEHSAFKSLFVFLGDAYVLIGVALFGFAAFDYFRTHREIEAGHYRTPRPFLIGMVLAISALTLLLMVVLTIDMRSR